MSNVHFNDALKKIPSKAITIEIGPHFLLQSILKRVIGSQAAYIGLMKRNTNNAEFLLQSLGKLYTLGLDPQVEKLYPPVCYPVPRSTPCISDLIKWDHSVSYTVPKWYAVDSGSASFVIKPGSSDQYLMDHCIEGRSLFPATGYITLAWEALASKNNRTTADTPVVFEDFKIHRATILSRSESTTFNVSFLNVSGDFEIMEGSSLVASGKVYTPAKKIFSDPPPEYKSSNFMNTLSGKDIYNELQIYGYEYGPSFQGVLEMNIDGTEGLVSWNDCWISYLDSLLLFFGLIHKCQTFPLPTGMLSFKIDPIVLKETVAERQAKGLHGLPVSFNQNTRRCRSAGVEIVKMNADPAPHRIFSENMPTLENYTFVPYMKPLEVSEDQKRECMLYMHVCSEVIKKISSSLGKGNRRNLESAPVGIQDFNIEDYVSNASQEHGLLNALKAISSLDTKKNGAEARQEILKLYFGSMNQDLMYNALVTEKILRIALDIVVENSYRKLNLLEVHCGLTIVSPLVIEITQRHSHKNFAKCMLISSDERSIDKEELANFNIQLQTPKVMNNLVSEKNQDLVISSFLFGNSCELQSHVRTLSSVTKHGGFIVLFCKTQTLPAENFLFSVCDEKLQVQSEDEIEKVFLRENLSIVSKFSDSFGLSLYLLRNPSNHSVLSYKFLHVTEDSFEKWVDELRNMVTQNNTDSERLWIISEDSEINGIIGMVNCLKQEPGGERIRCIFVGSKCSQDKLPPFSFEEPFYSDVLERDLLMNVYKNGSWGSFRHLTIDNVNRKQLVDYSFLNCSKYGDLSSFQWLESSIKYQDIPKDDKILVHVYYAALNFRDVMHATGKLSVGATRDVTGDDTCVLGFEFSGRDSSGQRIMGVTDNRGLASAVVAKKSHIYKVPDHWTLEEAATVPIVYMTCYYALFVRGQLKKGDSILIHSGTGGIGQAAIYICLSMDCEIFTTVGNEDKRTYLKKKFPQIKDENIGCSRDLSFEDLVMERTAGKGVGIVLNSLADDKLKASIRCLKKHGRFLEIGKYDMAKDTPLGMGVFCSDTTIHGVSLDTILHSDDSLTILQEVKELFTQGLESGVIQPLDRTVFERDDAEKAFRYMAGGTHVGKVMLRLREEESNRLADPELLKLSSTPRTYFHSHKVYIIVGGLGGFGIELAKWMARKGAKKLILTSRYGERTPYHSLCLLRWKREGTKVVVSTLNVTKKDEAKKLLQEASALGPVGGIFNSAVVLKDAFLENQNCKDFEDVCAPKATATKHLDVLSRSLCPSLDYFVCFSSISCGRGNAGQTNYGYANSVMERICEKRRSVGLHGLAVQWGIIGGVGVVHRHMGDDARIAGVCAQSVKSCLDALDFFCPLEYPVVSSYVSADAINNKTEQGDIMAQLAKIFGLNDSSEFNAQRSLAEMGVDSMIGVEIRQLLESRCDVSVTMQELQEMKIEDLKILAENAESKRQVTEKSSNILMTTTHVNFPKSFVPDCPIIPLNSEKSGVPVFVVCIGDNDLQNLHILANSISHPVYALQLTKDAPSTNVQSMATWYLQVIKEMLGQSAIQLVGYALGGSLAYEMALQSEKLYSVTTLCLLEGSTTLMKTLDTQDATTEDEISNLCDFVAQFVSTSIPQLTNELKQKETSEQRVVIVVNALLKASNDPVDKHLLSEAVHSYLKRKKIVQSYVPNGKMMKDIIIIESSSQLLANEVSLVKSLFSKICDGKIDIHRVPGSRNFVSETEGAQKVATLLNSVFKN